MPIEQEMFINENELHSWVEANIKTFLGDVLYVPGNFFISTKRNKGGKPDGFVLDINNSSWSIIESELLRHGVWDHIAEQIIRFVVAAQNDITKRKIRDVFFDAIEKDDLIERYAKLLNTPQHRLAQRIENIIEGQAPDVAIFIDEVNEDLEDMVAALNATVKVFRIQKYNVNGAIEYLPPEGSQTIIETTVEDVSEAKLSTAKTLELLGGGRLVSSNTNVKLYHLGEDDKVAIKFSKYYPSDKYYWYGITPSTIGKYGEDRITHVVFVLGTEGVVKLPIDVLRQYLDQARKSLNADGEIRHYHVYVKVDPERSLWINSDSKSWSLEQYFYVFDN